MDLDLVLATNDGAQIWLNEGQGEFTDTGQKLGDDHVNGIALGDVDSDGDVDIFASNGNGSPNRVWLNDGNGVFQDSGVPLGNANSQSVSLGDIDNDGDLDAVVANFASEDEDLTANRMWINDGHGSFQILLGWWDMPVQIGKQNSNQIMTHITSYSN